MSRSHYRPRPLPPRRSSHAEHDNCVIVRPPGGEEDTFFGFCSHLGLWRIKAPPVDAHGTIEPDASIGGFYEALAAAVDELRPVRPELADALEPLLPRHDQ